MLNTKQESCEYQLLTVFKVVSGGPVPDPISKSPGPLDTFSKSLEVQTGPPGVFIAY